MPGQTILPFPDPQQNVRVSWPAQRSNFNVGSAFETIGLTNDFNGPTLWAAGIGAGANTIQLRHGIACGLFGPTVTRTFTPYPGIKDTVANLGVGMAGAEALRVYRLQVLLSMDGVLTRASGLQFSPATAVGGSFTEIGQPAFGVVGDGAGGWEYIQSDTGAFPGNVTNSVLIPVATVPDALEWNTFDFELINSAPTRAASMSLFVNGVLVATRNWTAAPILPLLTEIVNATKFVWAIRSATVAVNLFVGPLTVQMGRFTRAGLELLT